MKALFVLLIIAFASADTTVNGAWVGKLYKVKEQLQLLNSKYDEIKDIQRLIYDKIDHAKLDLESALPEAKAEIAKKISEMQGQIGVHQIKKTLIKNAIKKVMKQVPEQYRAKMIRQTKLESKFDPVDDVLNEAASVQPNKKAVRKAVKKALKNI